MGRIAQVYHSLKLVMALQYMDRRDTVIRRKVNAPGAGNHVGVGVVERDAFDRNRGVHHHDLWRGDRACKNRLFVICIGRWTTAPVVVIPGSQPVEVPRSIRTWLEQRDYFRLVGRGSECLRGFRRAR